MKNEYKVVYFDGREWEKRARDFGDNLDDAVAAGVEAMLNDAAGEGFEYVNAIEDEYFVFKRAR